MLLLLAALWAAPEPVDYALMAADSALVLVDMHQTIKACHDPYAVYCERGLLSVVSRHPTDGQVRAASLLGIGAVLGLGVALPPPWRRIFLGVVFVGEGVNVVLNF